jgi:putative CocE/NonD family hydrolase
VEKKMLVDRDVEIVMRDGLRVKVDVFRPEGSGPFPALYAVSPFDKNAPYLTPRCGVRWGEPGNIARWVEAGYVFIHGDTRRPDQSREGPRSLWSIEELTDFFGTIEWAAGQPWSNGKVGMIGDACFCV